MRMKEDAFYLERSRGDHERFADTKRSRYVLFFSPFLMFWEGGREGGVRGETGGGVEGGGDGDGWRVFLLRRDCESLYADILSLG